MTAIQILLLLAALWVPFLAYAARADITDWWRCRLAYRRYWQALNAQRFASGAARIPRHLRRSS